MPGIEGFINSILSRTANETYHMKKPEPQDLSFEAALQELEGIINSMESGELPLEKSLALYRRGTDLLQFCQRSLEEAQQQVRILSESQTWQNFPGADAGS